MKSPYSYMQVGLQLAISVILGFYAGYSMDKKFNTSPVLMLAGCVVGITVGFYLFFKDLPKNGQGKK